MLAICCCQGGGGIDIMWFFSVLCLCGAASKVLEVLSLKSMLIEEVVFLSFFSFFFCRWGGLVERNIDPDCTLGKLGQKTRYHLRVLINHCSFVGLIFPAKAVNTQDTPLCFPPSLYFLFPWHTIYFINASAGEEKAVRGTVSFISGICKAHLFPAFISGIVCWSHTYRLILFR